MAPKKTNKKIVPAENEFGVISTAQRCTLLNFYKIVNGFKDHIPLAVWDLLRDTPFWPMIEVLYREDIGKSDINKKESDFAILMKSYDREEDVFVFGKQVMKITEEDVHNLFHLPLNNGEVILPIPIKDQTSRGAGGALFPSVKISSGPTRKQVEEVLRNELGLDKNGNPFIKKKKPPVPKKVASLLLMHLMASFFFPWSRMNITWELVQICLDLNKLSNYNWPASIVQFLSHGLYDYPTDGTASQIHGCLLLVEYVFLERTRLQLHRAGVDLELPRFARWSIRELFDLNKLEARRNMLEELLAAGPWPEQAPLRNDDDDDDDDDDDSNDEQFNISTVELAKKIQNARTSTVGEVNALQKVLKVYNEPEQRLIVPHVTLIALKTEELAELALSAIQALGDANKALLEATKKRKLEIKVLKRNVRRFRREKQTRDSTSAQRVIEPESQQEIQTKAEPQTQHPTAVETARSPSLSIFNNPPSQSTNEPIPASPPPPSDFRFDIDNSPSLPHLSSGSNFVIPPPSSPPLPLPCPSTRPPHPSPALPHSPTRVLEETMEPEAP